MCVSDPTMHHNAYPFLDPQVLVNTSDLTDDQVRKMHEEDIKTADKTDDNWLPAARQEKTTEDNTHKGSGEPSTSKASHGTTGELDSTILPSPHQEAPLRPLLHPPLHLLAESQP